MLTPRSRLGRKAEIAAAAELGKRGYRIIASNYRCRYGEIDLIANECGELVFVEVRCKTSNAFVAPIESITRSKQYKLIKTAENYLYENGLSDISCRFDVVEVGVIDGRPIVLDIIKNAFTA